MNNNWYPGPWTIIAEDSLEKKARIKPGDIMKHRSGNVLLNCPACNSLQFTKVQTIGTAELPSLTGPVLCGAGFCKRCAITFTVIDGKTVAVEAQERPKATIPERLLKAGVTRPPVLDDIVAKVKARESR